MRVAAKTFCITPGTESISQSLTGTKVARIDSPLQTTLTLLEDNGRRLCILSSHAITHFYRFCNVIRPAVAGVLEIEPSRVVCFSSHNHCSFQPFPPDHELAVYGKLTHERTLALEELTPEGRLMVDLSCRAAAELPAMLQEAEVYRALGHERRISYNRKGHRADGSTYLIREEDRLLLGEDFNGDIDDAASVVAFVGSNRRPICFLASFTAHPVTSFHPEHPTIFGDYSQVACDHLSAAFGDVPVGFLQGCAGDVNSKGMMSHKPIEQSVEDARRFGHLLGDTFVTAVQSMSRCQRHDFAFGMKKVHLPFGGVPPPAELEMRIADLQSFIQRCEANDPDTRTCQGLNFPANMSPRYRAALVGPLLTWARWAKDFHVRNRLHEAPAGVDPEIAAIRIGDVGIIGLPCEPFDAIGRRIKRLSGCAMTIPCGYMNDDYIFYVPDSGNNGDLDYQSAFYRYTTSLLPYAQPAGDLLADEGVRLLKELSGS